ncbi:hypothetical protein DFH08DRAFT_818119 [Mycena albidolilacea]|uniref:Uncharacterized protein n=1 Tax=Mycena albidolilacea TaxID=1033008 RepID=A0AAD6ZHU0_9AGAR|nr:hypothetical protein DFH08DRAFT_818119 [Mycena albidolilacea]
MIKLARSVRTIPVLPTLNMLSVALLPMREAVHILDALEAAPNITELVLSITLYDKTADLDYAYFLTIINKKFPWVSSESTKSVLTRKFPLIQRIGFHFYAQRNSVIHFRRGLRRKMERQLRARLGLTGDDVGEYLEVRWFDRELKPVAYSKKKRETALEAPHLDERTRNGGE